MNRRDNSLLLLALCATTWPPRLSAQAPRRIGLLLTAETLPDNKALFASRLKELGWEQGRNVEIVERSAQGKLDQLPALAQELVDAKVELVATFLNAATFAMQRVAPSIPVVMVIGADPVAAGIVRSLAHPGGNVTGLSFDAAPETYGKHLEILRALVPKAQRVGVLWESAVPGVRNYVAALDQAAQKLRFELRWFDLSKDRDFSATFEAMRADQLAGFVSIGGPLIQQRRKELSDLAAKFRLPGVWHSSAMVRSGGLISYGAMTSHFWLRAAEYVDRILRGARPADLPVQLPTHFELVLNRRRAQELGLVIPHALALQVTEVIE